MTNDDIALERFPQAHADEAAWLRRLSVAEPCGTSLCVTDAFETTVREFSIEKALAIAAYGESVAAHRYRTLAEKTNSPKHRAIFEEMAEEEQQHHVAVQELIKSRYPGSDFVLTAADKDLVIVGSRLLEIGDREAFARAIELICASERLTGRFYAALHNSVDDAKLRPVLKEMADECFEHAAKLAEIPLPD